jgi:small multidrug resistance family-3 protein
MTLWLIYALAAVLEIAGCFAFWAWLRNGQSIWWTVPGVLLLAAFAAVLTRVEMDAAGRAYAAYGGIYIAASLLWLWLVEQQRPGGWDLLGASVSVAGAIIILAGASGRLAP